MKVTFEKIFILTVSFAVLGVITSPSSALTINSIFRNNNEVFSITSTRAGHAPTSIHGSGHFQSIFETATNWWERAILDTHTITIDYGWAPQSGGILAQAWGIPARTQFTHGSILFDNDGSTNWFFDPSPTGSSQWNTFTSSNKDLGGGEINTGLIYSNPTGNARGNSDLFTVALHEIGHALGFSNANFAYDFSNPVIVNDGSYIGTSIPTRNGAHIDIGTSLLYPFLTIGQRRLPSEVDILAVATTGGFNSFDVSASSNTVPVPGAFLSLISGLFALIFLQKRKKA